MAAHNATCNDDVRRADLGEASDPCWRIERPKSGIDKETELERQGPLLRHAEATPKRSPIQCPRVPATRKTC